MRRLIVLVSVALLTAVLAVPAQAVKPPTADIAVDLGECPTAITFTATAGVGNRWLYVIAEVQDDSLGSEGSVDAVGRGEIRLSGKIFPEPGVEYRMIVSVYAAKKSGAVMRFLGNTVSDWYGCGG